MTGVKDGPRYRLATCLPMDTTHQQRAELLAEWLAKYMQADDHSVLGAVTPKGYVMSPDCLTRKQAE